MSAQNSTLNRHAKLIGISLIASILVLTPALTFYAYSAISLSGSSSGSIAAAAAIITSVHWVPAVGAACTEPAGNQSFSCTGFTFHPGQTSNTLGIKVTNSGSTPITFTPQSPTITGDPGSFITYVTPSQTALGPGGVTTFIYTFSVSSSATPEPSVSISTSILGP